MLISIKAHRPRLVRALPLLIIAALVAVFTGARGARAVTIDFESLVHTDSNVNLHVEPYSEDGFTLTAPVGNLLSNGTLRPNFSGSTALYNGFQDGVQRLTQGGGGTFSLISIDLSELNRTQPTQVFTGFLEGGGTVTQQFTLDGVAFGSETFVFGSSFGILTAVEWTSLTPGSLDATQYDNIVVGPPVPEPSAALVFAVGALVVGRALRRRTA